MAKKDKFEANWQHVHGDIEQATGGRGTQAEATPEELEQRQREMRTQGRKGCKMARINMAFTPENHEFIKKAARYKTMNLTEFMNHIIEQYREEHAEAYQRILENAEEL